MYEETLRRVCRYDLLLASRLVVAREQNIIYYFCTWARIFDQSAREVLYKFSRPSLFCLNRNSDNPRGRTIKQRVNLED